jgi:hypothetical protein
MHGAPTSVLQAGMMYTKLSESSSYLQKSLGERCGIRSAGKNPQYVEKGEE